MGVVGWTAPTKKGQAEQVRNFGQVDIEEALADPIVRGVLERWFDARQYFPDGAPPYSGGVLDSWPAIDVDSFAICYGEEQAIDAFLKFREETRDA